MQYTYTLANQYQALIITRHKHALRAFKQYLLASRQEKNTCAVYKPRLGSSTTARVAADGTVATVGGRVAAATFMISLRRIQMFLLTYFLLAADDAVAAAKSAVGASARVTVSMVLVETTVG